MHTRLSHLPLLNDERRVKAFRKSIRKVVRPGDTVVDMGAGTGVLGMIAAQVGAKKVWCIEDQDVIRIAQETAERSGLRSKMEFVQRDFFTCADIPRCDVVICELIGDAIFDEKILDAVVHAREHLLKRNGILLPGRIDVVAEPVLLGKAAPPFATTAKLPGIDLTAIRRAALNLPSKIRGNPYTTAAKPGSVGSIDLGSFKPGELPIAGERTWTCTVGGLLAGILLTARIQVTVGVKLLADGDTHWMRPLFPTAEPFKTRKRDTIFFSWAWHTEHGYNWTLQITRNQRTVYESTHSGMYADPRLAALFGGEIA